jgi:WD40 repeat protein
MLQPSLAHRIMRRFSSVWRATLVLIVALLVSLGQHTPSAAAQVGRAPISIDNRVILRELVRIPFPNTNAVTWSPDSLRLAAATAGGAFLFDTPMLLTGVSAPSVIGDLSVDAPVQAVAFRPATPEVALAIGGRIEFWNTTANVQTGTLDGIAPIAFDQTGTLFAYVSGDGLRVIVVDSVSKDPVMELTGHTERILDMRFAPFGTTFVSVSLDNTLRVWDAVSGAQFRFQRSRSREFTSVTFSPTGAIIASAVERGMIRLLNLPVTTERAFTVRSPRTDVSSVDFNPLGNLIVYTVGDTLQVWDMNDNSEPTVFPLGVTAREARFSPDGSLLALLTDDGMIQLWGI